VVGGWQRVLSPLTWQSTRGLQVESLPATPLMWLRSVSRNREWLVGLSRYNAYEIDGPGVPLALQIASVATLLGFLLAIILGVRAAWSLHRSPRAVATVMIAIILIMIDVNKTLSPQYLLWLGGPLAALIGGGEDDSKPSMSWPVIWALICFVLAFLTQVVYPMRYSEIVNGTGAHDAVAFLVVRNILLLIFTVIAIWQAWRLTRLRTPKPAELGSLEVEVSP
jgi:4-amino-4-deoxy-L-arabinose transferase-like glycosyltransferase